MWRNKGVVVPGEEGFVCSPRVKPFQAMQRGLESATRGNWDFFVQHLLSQSYSISMNSWGMGIIYIHSKQYEENWGPWLIFHPSKIWEFFTSSLTQTLFDALIPIWFLPWYTLFLRLPLWQDKYWCWAILTIILFMEGHTKF